MSISDFYRGKTILLTGTTGFVGKVILEKILRSTDCKCIYVMMRPKKTVTPEERLIKEILSSEIFSFVNKKNPQLSLDSI